MPLPPSVEREELHVRRIEFRGYQRSDGLFDIEGRVSDVKTRSVHPPGRADAIAAGERIHDMWVRLVVDGQLRIESITAVTDSSPYPMCPDAHASLQQLKGAQIGPGWTARVKALVGGQSCTHVVELLIPMGTAAYQTIAPARFARPDPLDASGRPRKIDSCYAYASDRPLVLQRWPAYYTGTDAETPADPAGRQGARPVAGPAE